MDPVGTYRFIKSFGEEYKRRVSKYIALILETNLKEFFSKLPILKNMGRRY
jgi:hypothetical protein